MIEGGQTGTGTNRKKNEQEQTRRGGRSKTRSFERTFFLNDVYVFLIFAGEFHLGVPMFGSLAECIFIDRTQLDIFIENLFFDLP